MHLWASCGKPQFGFWDSADPHARKRTPQPRRYDRALYRLAERNAHIRKGRPCLKPVPILPWNRSKLTRDGLSVDQERTGLLPDLSSVARERRTHYGAT